jgi:exodeoxyribonuclease V alpha subunit
MRGVVTGVQLQRDTFTIATFHPDGELLGLTIIGSMPGLTEGMELLISGQWTMHPKFGEQFKVAAYSIEQPRTREGIARYLGSGLIPGIGHALAERIVAMFGERTLEVMDNHLDRLRAVSGIGAKKLEAIKPAWEQQRKIAGLMSLLAGYGVGPATAARIYKELGDKAEETVRLSPYQLTQIRGIGFITADNIARQAGLPVDDPARLEAGLVHTLSELAGVGHTCAPRPALVAQAAALLGVAAELVDPALDRLLKHHRLYRETGAVVEAGGEPVEAIYLPWLYRAETGVVGHLRRLLETPSPLKIKAGRLPRRVGGITLSDRQHEAVRLALTQKVAIITGGPGTGKSTITKAILSVLRDHDITPTLAAPTGRAAKRIAEVTGGSAKTIHRLLGATGPGKFAHDEEAPLEGEFYIVDETSMVDIALFHALLRALPAEAHLVIVGDADQLPSVGPGNVLADLIASGAIPTVRLNVIFRQAADSTIITNAHRINEGKFPWFPQNDPDPAVRRERRDFFFIAAADQPKAAEIIEQVVVTRLPKAFGVKPDDIQVLSPLRTRGEAGANALNRRLQAALNPLFKGEVEAKSGDRVFRAGDRIIQTKNDYDRGVFNGEIGRVLTIDPDQSQLTAQFEDVAEPVVYAFGDLVDLDLAYAMSIHKSQGSEYPVVVIPVVSAHYIMLRRNTALHRRHPGQKDRGAGRGRKGAQPGGQRVSPGEPVRRTALATGGG